MVAGVEVGVAGVEVAAAALFLCRHCVVLDTTAGTCGGHKAEEGAGGGDARWDDDDDDGGHKAEEVALEEVALTIAWPVVSSGFGKRWGCF